MHFYWALKKLNVPPFIITKKIIEGGNRDVNYCIYINKYL